MFFLKYVERMGWKKLYMQGAALEIYTERLSNSFVGLTFPQSALYENA